MLYKEKISQFKLFLLVYAYHKQWPWRYNILLRLFREGKQGITFFSEMLFQSFGAVVVRCSKKERKILRLTLVVRHEMKDYYLFVEMIFDRLYLTSCSCLTGFGTESYAPKLRSYYPKVLHSVCMHELNGTCVLEMVHFLWEGHEVELRKSFVLDCYSFPIWGLNVGHANKDSKRST